MLSTVRNRTSNVLIDDDNKENQSFDQEPLHRYDNFILDQQYVNQRSLIRSSYLHQRDTFAERRFIFQNHQGEFLCRLLTVKSNPIYVANQELELVDRSSSSTFLQGANVPPQHVPELRILIDEDTAINDFAIHKTTLPARKIVIAYSSREFTTRLMEITLGITGQAAISLMAYASTSSSSTLPGLHFVVAANAIGFIGTFVAMWLIRSKERVAAASVVGKIGAIAAACAMIIAMGLFLPVNYAIWIVGFACISSAVAVVLS